MIYKQFGKTGIEVSNLGFGCMRLPMITKDGKEIVDDEKAGPLLQRAVELGVNYFDSHWFYCNNDSQRALGKALKNVRDKVYISTKIPCWLVEKSEDFDIFLEKALEQLDMDYIDFYHLPYMSYNTWKNKIVPLKLLDRAEKAKSKGLIKHLSFSYHYDILKMRELIDTGAFSSVLGQYNLADRESEELFAYAKDKGVGTVVMVPLMGGAFTDGGETLLKMMESDASSAAELGLRFTWSLPAVDMVLSGMTTMQQLEDNVRYAKNAGTITAAERQAMIDKSDSLKRIKDVFCTTCNYCYECPAKINISRIFQMYMKHYVWGLTESVREMRYWDEPFGLKVQPSACTNCGYCVEKCPQDIDIPNELKRVWEVLMGL